MPEKIPHVSAGGDFGGHGVGKANHQRRHEQPIFHHSEETIIRRAAHKIQKIPFIFPLAKSEKAEKL